jgi:hypothetical protein
VQCTSAENMKRRKELRVERQLGLVQDNRYICAMHLSVRCSNLRITAGRFALQQGAQGKCNLSSVRHLLTFVSIVGCSRVCHTMWVTQAVHLLQSQC